MAQSFNASLNVSLNTASLNASTKQVKQALGRITGQASEFQKSLDASTARVFAFGATTAVLNGVTQSFKKLISTTIEVEKRLIEVNSIFQATEASFNKFRNSIFQVAKETGQSFSTVADGAAELARQGLSAEETASRLKSALVLTRISGLDAEKSVKALTAAINGFESAGLKHTEIVNKMVAVDTAFAVSAQDLAEAFSRAGSTAEDAGVSFDQLLGLVTAVEQKTARGGAVIGNAFKSIFTRLSRGTTIEDLKELGVQIDATQTGVQKLSALSSAIEGISDPTVVSKIKELAGGVFQINVVSAALKDLSSETGIFKEAAMTASNATNEAFEKNRALGESLADNINKLVVGLTSLAEKVGSMTFGPVLESLVGIATKFTEFLDNALDPEKGNTFIKGFFKSIGTFLSGPAIVLFTTAFIKITKLIARFAGDGLKSLFQMGTQTERIAQIEGGIVGLLQRDATLRKQMESTTMSQAQKEQAVIAAIKRENALLTTQAQLMRNLASAAAARGVRGFNDSRGFTGRRGKRFNAGFRAEEAEAMMLGASPNVKAHMGRGTIGGQKFIMNNQEMEVPNFAGGRDSAVIPRYPKGFVPNYASRGNLMSIINSKQPKGNRFHKTKEEKAAAQKELNAMDARAANKASGKGRINVRASNYGFLVPSKAAGASASAFKTGVTEVGGVRYPFNITDGIKAFSPAMTKSEINKDAEPYDSRIEEKITKSVNKSALDYAKLLVVPKGVNRADAGDIKRRLGQGGQRGAFGAIRGAVGAAFEAAVFSALGLDEFKAARGGADWDVRNLNTTGNGEVAQIFNSGTRAFGDMKVGASESTVSSFIGKILKHNPIYADDMSRHRAAKKTKEAKGKARGFIPNFTRRGGVPMSMMRVHKDDQGEPVAVTNLRDEPNGLQDAVKRERNGIGMFAGGFVPNYNAGAILKLGPKITSLGKILFKAENRVTTLGVGFMGLTTVAGSVTASMEQQHALLDSMNDSSKELINTQDAIAQKGVLAISDELMARDELTNSLKEQRTLLQSSAEGLMKLAGVGSTIAMLFAFRGGGGGAATAPKGGPTTGGFFSKANKATAAKVSGPISGASAGPFGVRPTPSAAVTAPKGGMGMTNKLGIAGAIVGLGFTAKEVSDISKRQDLSKQDKKFQKGRTAGKGIGGILGGIGGAIGTGALVGMAGGPVGGLAGAAIGLGAGLLGGVGGAILGGMGGEAIGGAAAGGAGDGSNPIEVLNNRIDDFLPQQLADMGFGEKFEDAQARFNERLVKTGNATPEFVTELTDAREKMAQFATALAIAEEETDGSQQGTFKLNQARKDAAAAERKLTNILLKGTGLKRNVSEDPNVTLTGKDRFQQIDQREGIEKAELEFSKVNLEAQKKIARANLRLASITEQVVKTAQANEREAGINNILAKSLRKTTADGTRIPDKAAILNAEQDVTMAGIDTLRAKSNFANSQLSIKENEFFGANQNLIPDSIRNIADMIEGGQSNELDDTSLANGMAYLEAVKDERAKVESSGINFEMAVKTAAANFEVKMTEIGDMEAENSKKRDETMLASISAASDSIKNIFGGEALDMDFMGQQVGEIVGEINKGDKMDPDVLGAMISEFDDQGLGVKIEDLIRQFDPSISIEKLQSVLLNTFKSGFNPESDNGKKLTGAMLPKLLEDKGIDITKPLADLTSESDSLKQQLATTRDNVNKLLNAEDAGGFASAVQAAKSAMNTLAETAANSVNPIDLSAQKTESVATLIDSNNQTLIDAKKTIETAKEMIRDAEQELRRARGE